MYMYKSLKFKGGSNHKNFCSSMRKKVDLGIQK